MRVQVDEAGNQRMIFDIFKCREKSVLDSDIQNYRCRLPIMIHNKMSRLKHFWNHHRSTS